MGGRQLSAPCSEADVAWLMSAAPHRLRNLRCCQISVSQHLRCSQTSKKSFQKEILPKTAAAPSPAPSSILCPAAGAGGSLHEAENGGGREDALRIERGPRAPAELPKPHPIAKGKVPVVGTQFEDELGLFEDGFGLFEDGFGASSAALRGLVAKHHSPTPGKILHDL